jgi:hypothetical protein
MEQKLPKESILALFEGTKTQSFLRGLKDWEAVSFDPQKREVCIRTASNYGIKIISLSIPLHNPIFK